MARFILVYSEEIPPIRNITVKSSADPIVEKSRVNLHIKLTHDLEQILDLCGTMYFTPEAIELTEHLNVRRFPPIPTHTKLVHYNKRRTELFLKLCLISSASAGNSLMVTKNDVLRAHGWMLEAEQTMPDVFASLVGRSDADLLDELHNFVYKIYTRDNKPVRRHILWQYLSTKTTSEKIKYILDTAVKSGLLRSEDIDGADGTAFVPLPKTTSFMH